MSASAIKKETSHLYLPKTPQEGGWSSSSKEKAKTAPKVPKDMKSRVTRNTRDKNINAASPSKRYNGLQGHSRRILPNAAGSGALADSNGKNISRCGEIFVTKNARKWTFICTFCQKSTRDIGEFVCHIKFKHMNSPYTDDDDDINDFDEGDDFDVGKHQMMPTLNMEEPFNLGQEYIDCTNYLDVNVHTEEGDEITPIKTEDDYHENNKGNSIAKKRGADVVSLLDDDENNALKKFKSDDSMYNDDSMNPGQDDEEGVQVINDADDNDDQNEHSEDADNNEELLVRRPSIEQETSSYSGYDMDTDPKRYRSHVKGTAYCEICDKTFQYYSLYRNHMIKHSNATPYKCQYCEKGFKSKQAIRYHMKTHSKVKPYRCPVCSTSYATSNLFMSHVLSHEGENCYPCVVCAKVLSTEQERQQHLDGHSQDRPYSCSFCSKRFRQKHHLSNHLKLHCQYRCDFCKESFTSTQAQRRPYACQTCEEVPDIRQQVERQRSFHLKGQEGSLMKFENVILQSNVPATTSTAEATECVAEVTEEEGSEESNSLLVSTSRKQYAHCKYCNITFSHIGALNFHIRQKHPEHSKHKTKNAGE